MHIPSPGTFDRTLTYIPHNAVLLSIWTLIFAHGITVYILARHIGESTLQLQVAHQFRSWALPTTWIIYCATVMLPQPIHPNFCSLFAQRTSLISPQRFSALSSCRQYCQALQKSFPQTQLIISIP